MDKQCLIRCRHRCSYATDAKRRTCPDNPRGCLNGHHSFPQHQRGHSAHIYTQQLHRACYITTAQRIRLRPQRVHEMDGKSRWSKRNRQLEARDLYRKRAQNHSINPSHRNTQRYETFYPTYRLPPYASAQPVGQKSVLRGNRCRAACHARRTRPVGGAG